MSSGTVEDENRELRRKIFERVRAIRERKKTPPCLCLMGMRAAGKSSSANSLLAALKNDRRYARIFPQRIAGMGTPLLDSRSIEVESGDGRTESIQIRDFPGVMSPEELLRQLNSSDIYPCDSIFLTYGRNKESGWNLIPATDLEDFRGSIRPKINSLKKRVFPILTNPSLPHAQKNFDTLCSSLALEPIPFSQFQNPESYDTLALSETETNHRLKFLEIVCEELQSRKEDDSPLSDAAVLALPLLTLAGFVIGALRPH